MDAAAAQPRPRPLYLRLAFWSVFVGLIAVGNYAARFSGSGSSSKGVGHQDVYSYSFFAGSTCSRCGLRGLGDGHWGSGHS